MEISSLYFMYDKLLPFFKMLAQALEFAYPERVGCGLCGRGFDARIAMIRYHGQARHNLLETDEWVPYQCYSCQLFFLSKSDWESHMDFH